MASSASAEEAEPAALEALLERMAATRGVEAHFRERKHIAILETPLESRGVLYFVPPDRLARFTSEPEFTALVVEGDGVRFREGRDGEEIDLSGSPVARVFVENFIVLWSGDRERLRELYRPELSTDGERWTLVLEPRTAPLDRFLDAIVLRGDESGMREMEVRDLDGDRTETSFDEVSVDRDFAPAEIERLFATRAPLDAAPGGR